MAAPDLSSHHAKLRHAKRHATALQEQISAWRNRDSGRFVSQSNADGSRYAVVLKLDETPPFEDWSLIAADAVHCARSALDNLVYAIAKAQVSPWPPPERVLKKLSFVIVEPPNDWQSSLYKLAILSPAVQGVIERVQPYNRRHALYPPLLSVLRDFDDFDKHRLLNLALMLPVEGEFTDILDVKIGNDPFIKWNHGRLENGSEIASMIFRIPQPNLKFKFRAELAIAVTHAPGPQGHTATGITPLVDDLIVEVEEVSAMLLAVI